MNGGSYDYLYTADIHELLTRMSDVMRMTNRLFKFGYAEDAAKESENLMLILSVARQSIDVHFSNLRDVWKAVEWVDSNDWGEDQLKEVLRKYRETRS